MTLAPADGLSQLLGELLSGETALRLHAAPRYAFDGRLEDLRRRLRTDGFDIQANVLVRMMPAAEPAARIGDHLEQALASSGLDTDGEIRRLLRESHSDISDTPPDFNGGPTKARIALETLARRSAAAVANACGLPVPVDSWGVALGFLRQQSVITLPEEEALAKVYTLISAGAHVPKGLTDEQWAMLSRTFAISGTYFLLSQHGAA